MVNELINVDSEYKITELGRIPVKWELKRIIDLANKNTKDSFIDGDWIESKHMAETGVRLIQTGNIGKGKFIEKKAKKYISLDTFGDLNCKEVFENDLLICRLASPIGRSCIVPKVSSKMITSVDVTIFRPIKDISPEFLNYYLNYEETLFRTANLASGSTRQRVSRKNLGNLLVLVPPFEEQQKIADILSFTDELIEKTNLLIQKTKELKKGLIQQLLTKGIHHTLFKHTELGDIPVEWKLNFLEEIVVLLDGMRKPIKKGDRVKGETPYYGATGIIDWVKDNIFEESLILVGEDGENLRSRVLPMAFKIEGKAWVNNHAHVLRPNKDVDIDYLTYYLDSIKYDDYITGSAQPKLNQNQLRKIKVILPPLAEQQEIAEILISVDDQIEGYEKEKEKQIELRKALTQHLFSGKLRVTR